MKLSTSITQGILTNLCGTKSGTHQVTIGSAENCWLGLFYGEPTNGGSEITGHGYERVNIYEMMSMTYQSYALGETESITHPRRIGNATQIAFPEAVKSNVLVDAEHGGRWHTATHWALFQTKNAMASSAIAWGELDEPITVDTHQVFIVRKGHLELYMEPDSEFVFYGVYATESAFIQAIRDNEEIGEGGTLVSGLHRVSVTERKMSITADVTGGYLFYAYPLDFKGTPSFRGEGTTDEYGDTSYEEYTAVRSDTAPICKSYYKTTVADTETVVMADRSNAYYVYKITGIEGSSDPLTGEIDVDVF